MSTRLGNLMKGVRCYELFGEIALKNHAFLNWESKWEIVIVILLIISGK